MKSKRGHHQTIMEAADSGGDSMSSETLLI
ncbi:hypothetical protein ABIE33_005207 [Ensifer sp. 4252]